MKTLVAVVALLGSQAFASVDELRAVAGFDGVVLEDTVAGRIRQGEKFSVKVSANDAEVLKRIKTELSGSVLKVYFDRSGSDCGRCEMKVDIVLPKLARLDVSGAAKADVEGTFGPKLEIEASGAAKIDFRGVAATALKLDASGGSNVNVSGKTEHLELDVSGASQVTAHALKAQQVIAGVSGASNAKIVSSAAIKADVSGTSHLSVKGQPAQRKVSTSGMSAVSWDE